MFGFRRTPSIVNPETAAKLDGSFSEHELEALSRFGTVVNLEAGAMLTVEGEIGREALVIADGNAAVSRGDEVIATVGSGDIIGEGSLVLEARRNASVVATTAVSAFVLNPREFSSLLHTCPRLEQVVKGLANERQPA